jgi:hypothetical protein
MSLVRYRRYIGPSLGADSIHKGVLASIVGMLAVMIFHARLLSRGRHQRGSDPNAEPGHPAWLYWALHNQSREKMARSVPGEA